ncbi:KTSC domain-containing protein [Klebsiella sp.]|uniref:KTSC domain-containing protein n=1 Tax=Klebsiella/Raoultella group TaxID=2890311 RepID=UPI000C290D47|nr:KTSC domain-containing protein [Raoultella sp. T31]
MQHQPVKSSRIASVAYDEASGLLEIRFHGDITLRYEKVPERIYRHFLQVVSKGRFYDGVIKGKFTEHRVTNAKM